MFTPRSRHVRALTLFYLPLRYLDRSHTCHPNNLINNVRIHIDTKKHLEIGIKQCEFMNKLNLSSLYIQLDSKQNSLVYCPGSPLWSFPYPIDKCSKSILKRLKSKVVLTAEVNKLRISMLIKVPISAEFIHSILMMYLFNERIKDYRKEKVRPFKLTNNIPNLEFVKIPNHYNDFFVIHYDHKNEALWCVEVHSHEPKVFNTAILSKDQVLPTRWNGPVEKSLGEYQEFSLVSGKNKY